MNSNYPSRLQLFIDGDWRGPGGRSTLPVLNPATEEVIAQLPAASAADIDDAIAAAQRAFAGWSATGAWERAATLMRAADTVRRRQETLARMLTVENGKPLGDSMVEIDRVVDAIVYCAEEAKRTYGRVLPLRHALLSQATLKRPVGPVAALVPWNFPAFLAARKVAAALAAGCTVVLKPAEETPAVCIELVRAFAEAGLPSGALNLLFGAPAQISTALIESPAIRKISFTGSVPVGRLLATQAAQQLKPVTMELGGHAPVVVFDDADLDAAVQRCVAFKYRNAGQVCLSPSRFYVQDSIADEFTRRFAQAASALRVGDGLLPGVQMGPLNNRRRLDAAEQLVAQARDAGAVVHAGGGRLDRKGYFYAPTVLGEVPASARVLHEEPFCPVAPMLRFTSMDEVLARANASEFGLAAYAFTNSLRRAAEFSERIEAAWIGVNHFTPSLAEAPVGGMKSSGLGYEGGPEGLDAYMHIRFVSQSACVI